MGRGISGGKMSLALSTMTDFPGFPPYLLVSIVSLRRVVLPAPFVLVSVLCPPNALVFLP